MLEKYHDAIMSAVRMLGEMETLYCDEPKKKKWWAPLLLRSSAVGVVGIFTTESLVVVSSNLGLLIRRVVHVCASTIARARARWGFQKGKRVVVVFCFVPLQSQLLRSEDGEEKRERVVAYE
ncbi:uncharacterized protein DS421_15g493530 [Arachis hypogaea]|nr:uncharacterized protein DS421_15g493530 [Arachis hypogaea]